MLFLSTIFMWYFFDETTELSAISREWSIPWRYTLFISSLCRSQNRRTRFSPCPTILTAMSPRIRGVRGGITRKLLHNFLYNLGVSCDSKSIISEKNLLVVCEVTSRRPRYRCSLHWCRLICKGSMDSITGTVDCLDGVNGGANDKAALHAVDISRRCWGFFPRIVYRGCRAYRRGFLFQGRLQRVICVYHQRFGLWQWLQPIFRSVPVSLKLLYIVPHGWAISASRRRVPCMKKEGWELPRGTGCWRRLYVSMCRPSIRPEFSSTRY